MLNVLQCPETHSKGVISWKTVYKTIYLLYVNICYLQHLLKLNYEHIRKPTLTHKHLFGIHNLALLLISYVKRLANHRSVIDLIYIKLSSSQIMSQQAMYLSMLNLKIAKNCNFEQIALDTRWSTKCLAVVVSVGDNQVSLIIDLLHCIWSGHRFSHKWEIKRKPC